MIAADVAVDGLGLDDEGRALLGGCDTVIHSAASVSFDSPLDTAVEVNLLGPTRMATALQDLGSRRISSPSRPRTWPERAGAVRRRRR